MTTTALDPGLDTISLGNISELPEENTEAQSEHLPAEPISSSSALRSDSRPKRKIPYILYV